MTTQDVLVFAIGFVAGLSAAAAGLICLSYFVGYSLRKADREGDGPSL